VTVSSQLTKPKGTNIMCRLARCFEVTKDFHASKCYELTLRFPSQAHLFPEAAHIFKRAPDMMPRQFSQGDDTSEHSSL
jgi:hypothetical protein